MRPTAFSLPGMVREEKMTRSPLSSDMSRMLVCGDARHGGARLALAAGRQAHDLVALQIGELLLVEVVEILRQIAGFDAHLDRAVQRAAGDDEAAAGGARRIRDRFHAPDVGGERGDDDAVLGAP